MKTAICPGSYDPVTNGHIDIIGRCTKLFDRVIVLIMVNWSKNPSFTAAERSEMLSITTSKMANVEVDICTGLIEEYAKQHYATVIVKGLCSVTDFEYKLQMAFVNKKLNPKHETIFIHSNIRYIYLSSSVVKEVASHGGDISDFVPTAVKSRIIDRLSPLKSRI